MKKLLLIPLILLLTACPGGSNKGIKTPGTFCKTSEIGDHASTTDGDILQCIKKEGQSQPHWVVVQG